jgi:hypothetical protein
MRMLAIALVLAGSTTAAQAAPGDDVHAYCAELHPSSQYRYVCEQGEQAAKDRLSVQANGASGSPREIFESCGRANFSWRNMELCVKKETRARALLQHR